MRTLGVATRRSAGKYAWSPTIQGTSACVGSISNGPTPMDDTNTAFLALDEARHKPILMIRSVLVALLAVVVLVACEEAAPKPATSTPPPASAPAPASEPESPEPPATPPPVAPSQPQSPPTAAPPGVTPPPATPPSAPQGAEPAAPWPSFSGSTTLSRSAEKGVAFSLTLPKATGGQGSLRYEFSCSSCRSNGLQYANHVISGTPTIAGVSIYAQYWAVDERGYWTIPWIQILVNVAAAPLPQPATANFVINMSGSRYRTLEYLGTSQHDFSVRWSSTPSELLGKKFAVSVGVIGSQLNIGAGRMCSAITLDEYRLTAFSTTGGRLTAICRSGVPSTSDWTAFWTGLNNKSFTCNGATANCLERS